VQNTKIPPTSTKKSLAATYEQVWDGRSPDLLIRIGRSGRLKILSCPMRHSSSPVLFSLLGATLKWWLTAVWPIWLVQKIYILRIFLCFHVAVMWIEDGFRARVSVPTAFQRVLAAALAPFQSTDRENPDCRSQRGFGVKILIPVGWPVRE
jgi:hypothetical protein